MGYLERLDIYKEDMLKTLKESISKPSVGGEPTRTAEGELMPYGRGVHDALLHMLSEGERLGFEVHNDDNYAGHIEFPAEDNSGADGYFGVVGHLDVVPVGTGWDNDPFEMIEKDGFLYGRGTSDDKGPVVASLYAMKALKDEGLVPHMPIRLVLGLDEETGPTSVDHYTENFGHPKMGFTPDGNFPLVNGELGIVVFELAQKFSSRRAKEELRLTKFEAGTAHNAVPEKAKAVISGDKANFDEIAEKVSAYREESGYEISSRKQGAALVIEATGKAAHGAHPDLGLNAASILFEFLGRIGFASEELNDFIDFYNNHIGFDLHGERMGCELSDEVSGPLIFNVGLVNINEDIATVTVNIRFPVTYSDEDVLERVQQELGDAPVGIVTRMVQPAIYMEPDDPMVIKLMQAYKDETGDADAKPMVIRGGTYAKMMNNILAFGAEFPDDENTMHQANEKLSADSLMKMAKIYARALYALCFEEASE
ncbi:MAG: dipeptidase PepV [Mogibacterium sp.]|nr:dipeptidase PepV [Mogibacterium sp.]